MKFIFASGCLNGICVNEPMECICYEGYNGWACDEPVCSEGCHPDYVSQQFLKGQILSTRNAFKENLSNKRNKSLVRSFINIFEKIYLKVLSKALKNI